MFAYLHVCRRHVTVFTCRRKGKQFSLFYTGFESHVNTDIVHNSDASEEVCPEVNADTTKYMLLSRHQNAGQNHDIKVAD
jgi:hypothetical protein